MSTPRTDRRQSRAGADGGSWGGRALAALAAFAATVLPAASAMAAAGTEAVAATFIDDVEFFFTGTHLGQLLGRIVLVLAILLFGWLLAKFISVAVYKALLKTTWDDRLAEALKLNMLIAKEQKDSKAIERITARVVYYLLLLLTVVAALQFSGLTLVAEPITALAHTIIQALPRILKAVLILLVAYIAARIVRMILTRALGWLDSWFLARTSPKTSVATEEGAIAPAPAAPAEGWMLSQGIATVVFWLIIVFGVVGALDALEIDSLSAPLSNAVTSLLVLLPAIAKAAIIVVAGYLLARIARTVVGELARSLGVDRVPAKLKVEQVFARYPLSEVLALVVFFFIVLQVTIAALQTVGLETLSAPLTAMVSRFWLILPAIGAAALLVVAGLIVGRLARGVVENVLKSVGFDRLLERLGFGELSKKNKRLDEPSELVGLLVQAAIVLLAVAQAMDVLGLDTWAAYVNNFLGYVLRHVLVALIIVVIGYALANHVREAILAGAAKDGHDESRLWLAMLARYAILVAAFTMAVIQLQVAHEFVLLAFGLMFGALCLAMALAFGLGSRGVAEEIVSRQYKKAREQLASESARAPVAGKAPAAGTGEGTGLGARAFKLGTPKAGGSSSDSSEG